MMKCEFQMYAKILLCLTVAGLSGCHSSERHIEFSKDLRSDQFTGSWELDESSKAKLSTRFNKGPISRAGFNFLESGACIFRSMPVELISGAPGKTIDAIGKWALIRGADDSAIIKAELRESGFSDIFVTEERDGSFMLVYYLSEPEGQMEVRLYRTP